MAVVGRSFGHLFRAFLAQFFTSETVTSDVQMRQAIIGVLAFVLTPCLMLLPRGFGQFQQLSYRARFNVPPAVIVRLNAVRGLAFQDLTEAVVSILIAYSMIVVGLVAVFAWDALTFDRRDAMVLGPLPITPATIVLAKLAALCALLLGASLGVNLLNSLLFAAGTADRIGFSAFAANLVSCLIVTTAAATLVFSTVVIVRGVVVGIGVARLAAVTGSLFQFAFVVVLLGLILASFASPHRQARLAVPETTLPPVTWFIAWFEVIRRSPRGAWLDVIAMSRPAQWLVPLSVLGAAATSVLAFRHQMRRALTPLAAPGPLGHARVSRFIARLLCGPDRISRAVSDFVLTTVVRNRAQQAPIAMNAAIGFAFVTFSFARQRGDSTSTWLAAPLVLAFWVAIGLRAAFFVPSELPAAWTFEANASAAFGSFARGVRAAIAGFIAPPAAAIGFAVGGPRYALLVALLAIGLADFVVLTIDFVPFTRAYRPGHAKLKQRWPVYLLSSLVVATVLPQAPLWSAAIGLAILESTLYVARRGWSIEPQYEEADDDHATVLNLTGALGRAT
jgi:hypothetical protein